MQEIRLVSEESKVKEDSNHKVHKGQYISVIFVVVPIVDVLVEHWQALSAYCVLRIPCYPIVAPIK